MENGILSTINDLNTLIENTIENYDDFNSNKNYILSSLNQIENWIIKNFNLFNNSLNSLKQNPKIEENKKLNNIIPSIKDNTNSKKTNDLNNTSYEIKLNNIVNKNISNNPNNSSNNLYENEFNSPIDYRIKYYKSKDYKGNQTINSSFDNNLSSQKYTIKSNRSLNSI